jgi:hypothetical protein
MLIRDPFGGELSLYRTIYGTIARALDAGLEATASSPIRTGDDARPHDRGTFSRGS